MPTQAVYYRERNGIEPVWRFLLRLTIAERGVVKAQIDEMNGLPDSLPPLNFPKTSQIDGALRELRCHSGSRLYRILYRRSGNIFVLLHVIEKKGRAVPRRDIELARRRWDDYRQRMDASVRRGPRPLGKDAP